MVASFIFTSDKINIIKLFYNINCHSNLIDALSLVFGILVYFGFAITIGYIYEVLAIKGYETFPVEEIDESVVCNNKIDGLLDLILSYSKLIVKYRDHNQTKSKYLKYALRGIVTTLLLLLTIYLNI